MISKCITYIKGTIPTVYFMCSFCQHGKHVGRFLSIISNPDVMPWDAEGCPGDVEPGGGCEELVGVFAGAEEGDELLELRGVFGADVGGLADEVL